MSDPSRPRLGLVMLTWAGVGLPNSQPLDKTGGGAALHWLGSLLEGQMMPGGEWPLRVAGQWAERQLLGFLLFVQTQILFLSPLS